MMGTIIGGTAMAGSLGMSTGPLLGGLIYDHFDSYTLMYLGSWGMGLAAMLMLMAFQPFLACALAGLDKLDRAHPEVLGVSLRHRLSPQLPSETSESD